MNNFPEDGKQGIYQTQIRRVTVDLFALVHCQDVRQSQALSAEVLKLRDNSEKGRAVNLKKELQNVRAYELYMQL